MKLYSYLSNPTQPNTTQKEVKRPMSITPKVLIVEDSTTTSLFMSQALRKAGYQVITAADGNEGLAKAVKERPHCLVLDVVLPGVSGFGICRQLRAMDPNHNLSIIMISSKNSHMDQSWGLRQGADRYLPKPFTEEVLLQTVEEVLMEHYRA
jgi:DNA-binding response OmpR family regulator